MLPHARLRCAALLYAFSATRRVDTAIFLITYAIDIATATCHRLRLRLYRLFDISLLLRPYPPYSFTLILPRLFITTLALAHVLADAAYER